MTSGVRARPRPRMTPCCARSSARTGRKTPCGAPRTWRTFPPGGPFALQSLVHAAANYSAEGPVLVGIDAPLGAPRSLLAATHADLGLPPDGTFLDWVGKASAWPGFFSRAVEGERQRTPGAPRDPRQLPAGGDRDDDDERDVHGLAMLEDDALEVRAATLRVLGQQHPEAVLEILCKYTGQIRKDYKALFDEQMEAVAEMGKELEVLVTQMEGKKPRGGGQGDLEGANDRMAAVFEADWAQTPLATQDRKQARKAGLRRRQHVRRSQSRDRVRGWPTNGFIHLRKAVRSYSHSACGNPCPHNRRPIHC